MGAGGSIPADEAAAKEAGKTDDEIAIYKFCVGLQDGSTKAVSAEGCEFGPPGAPPLPIDAMLGICKNMVGALPDWKSLCLGIEKNEDGTYTVLTQQLLGAMKGDFPLIEGMPFPEVKVAEIPDEAKIEITLPVGGSAQIKFRGPDLLVDVRTGGGRHVHDGGRQGQERALRRRDPGRRRGRRGADAGLRRDVEGRPGDPGLRGLLQVRRQAAARTAGLR